VVISGQGERWVQRQLSTARQALEQSPPGPGDRTLEQYEADLRRIATTLCRPTRGYVGRPLAEAQAKADQAGDDLCVHRGRTGHRTSLRPTRVHLELGPGDVVRAASRDEPPW
jgi:hypothetical protein